MAGAEEVRADVHRIRHRLSWLGLAWLSSAFYPETQWLRRRGIAKGGQKEQEGEGKRTESWLGFARLRVGLLITVGCALLGLA